MGSPPRLFTVTVNSAYTAVPGKPTGVVVTPGVGSLTLEWEPPTGGGSEVSRLPGAPPARRLRLHRRRRRLGPQRPGSIRARWSASVGRRARKDSSGGPACQNPRSYTISNLIGGRDYDVAIRARNANGWGDWLSVGEFNLPNGFPPVLQHAEIGGATMSLIFDRSLDTDSLPSTSVFSVSVNGTSQTPTGLSISGSTLFVTLGTAVTSGQTVTVSYVRPTQTPLQHNDAQAPSFSNVSVHNFTP